MSWVRTPKYPSLSEDTNDFVDWKIRERGRKYQECCEGAPYGHNGLFHTGDSRAMRTAQEVPNYFFFSAVELLSCCLGDGGSTKAVREGLFDPYDHVVSWSH